MGPVAAPRSGPVELAGGEVERMAGGREERAFHEEAFLGGRVGDMAVPMDGREVLQVVHAEVEAGCRAEEEAG